MRKEGADIGVALGKKPVNILWYCTDQQRYDTIHGLGNEQIHTPALDQLVESGVSFTRAYCQSPICTPSRASFLTGRYPATHHVHRNGNEQFPDNEVLVTRILAGAGYDCGLVGKLHLSRSDVLERRPKHDGYRYFKWSHHPNPDYPRGHDYADWLKQVKGVDAVELYGGLHGSVGPGVPAELHQTTWCSEMAVDFIRQEREQPWFLSVNPFDPHPPFDPPQEYIDRYDPKSLSMPLFRATDIERQRAFERIDQQTRRAIDPRKAGHEKHDEADIPRGNMGSTPPKDYDPQYVKACYYAMIELIDEQFVRLLDVLETTGQLDSTMIIFTSDHGELLGDHGLIYKGCRFFEGLVHVPLIVSWAGNFSRALRSDALVELVDLAPTILDVAGLDIPYFMQGKSLKGILTGNQDPSFHKDHVVSEYNDAVGGYVMSDHSHGFMYFDGRYKVVIYERLDVGEIYDLESDPGEFDNLWEHQDKAELKARLLHEATKAYLGTSSAGILRTGDY